MSVTAMLLNSEMKEKISNKISELRYSRNCCLHELLCLRGKEKDGHILFSEEKKSSE